MKGERKNGGWVQREPPVLFLFSLGLSGYLYFFKASTKLWNNFHLYPQQDFFLCGNTFLDSFPPKYLSGY